MNYQLLASKKPNAVFYKSFDSLLEGEFPIINTEYRDNGKFNHSKFNKDYDGIDIMTHISRAGFTDSAMGYHHVSSLTNSLESE